MNDQNPIEHARIAVERILDVLSIVRVVFVDDANDGNVSLEEVIAGAVNLDSSQLLATFPELGENIPDDKDVLIKKVRDVWGQIDPGIQAKRGQAVLVAARHYDVDSIDDVADVSILSALVPSTKLVTLSPKQWEAQKDRFLREGQDHRTLFLFDRDFSEAGGDANAGIKIIASLLASDKTGNLICGLLTHTVKPEEQPQKWAELSRDHSIPKDRFMVIPKLHLSQDPILFAQILKFVALSPSFAELKRKTKDIIAAAATVAASRVDDVSIYDLDHIVFQVSAVEGLWEPDMLFRLHALFHRLESRRLAHQDGNLESIAAKLRAVSGIPTNCELFPPPSSAWTLQREELYESDEYINMNHLPIDLGDIFERVGTVSTKRYILLAQPCDLMVRSDGRRHPELHRVPLAEVVLADARPHYAEEMPYFDESSTKRWYIKLKQVHFVRVCILDICVFNPDGTAKLSVTGSAPPDIRPAWKARREILSRYWRLAINRADIFTPAANESEAVKQYRQKIAGDIGDLLFEDDLFKGSLTDAGGVRTLTYNCKRVGHLLRTRAIGLLMSYTATLGRPAYEREFGET